MDRKCPRLFVLNSIQKKGNDLGENDRQNIVDKWNGVLYNEITKILNITKAF